MSYGSQRASFGVGRQNESWKGEEYELVEAPSKRLNTSQHRDSHSSLY
jgi:hypothetical protein